MKINKDLIKDLLLGIITGGIIGIGINLTKIVHLFENLLILLKQ